jgi:DNA-binding NarL/FixJ family response regulator
LSLRQKQVQQEVYRGETNKEIAESTILSSEMIKGCIKTILVKLDARDQTHAVVMAIQRGFAPEQ